MIRVLITDDSPVIREQLSYILSSDKDLQVVGTAKNGLEAVEFVKREKPDVITMDMEMPYMNGFEATRKIMETNPVPIIIVSASWEPNEVQRTFRSMEAGALAVLEKPVGMDHLDYDKTVKELLRTVKLMSEVKVVRRWPKLRQRKTVSTKGHYVEPDLSRVNIELIGIGISTGGPPILKTILSGLPKNFPVPVLIVQHIAAGFLQGMISWLTQATGHSIHIPTHGERLLPGNIYLAPDDFHLGVQNGCRAILSKDSPRHNVRPSVSYLFDSVAKTFEKNAIGVLLTGMGKDGAQELKLMKEKGAITIVQDRKSSIVYGMPGEAIKLGAATYVLSSDKIAEKLDSLVNKNPQLRRSLQTE